jgi:hypothetical protein
MTSPPREQCRESAIRLVATVRIRATGYDKNGDAYTFTHRVSDNVCATFKLSFARCARRLPPRIEAMTGAADCRLLCAAFVSSL